MLFLIQHIGSDRFDLGSPHCERAVALLPSESRPIELSPYPSRRFALQLSQYVRHPMSRPQPSKDMDMVASSADGMGNAVHAADRSAEVFVDAGPCFGAEPRLPVFRREDEVVVQGCVRRGHPKTSRAPAGAQLLPDRYTRWFRFAPPPATFSAPSGSVGIGGASMCVAVSTRFESSPPPAPLGNSRISARGGLHGHLLTYFLPVHPFADWFRPSPQPVARRQRGVPAKPRSAAASFRADPPRRGGRW